MERMIRLYYRDTWIEVNLDAIHKNLAFIQNKTSKNCIAVLKANAYGHGDYAIAEAVVRHGITMVAVAYLDEAISLRLQGYIHDILVLGYVRARDLKLAKQYQITLTVPSMLWLEETIQNESIKNIKFHIKIDTGMNRLGIKSLDECLKVIQLLQKHEGIIDGIYTHFACADEIDNDMNQKQSELFSSIVKQCNYEFQWIHCDNSAAALTLSNSFANAVRIGIILYGTSPIEEEKNYLAPAFSLFSSITNIKYVKKGEKIGYNATYTMKQDGWIATLPIGYADGFIRENQGRYLYIEDTPCQIVGRVCMDQCMILCDQFYPLETKVEIIGKHVNIYEMAKELHTIPYEVLCLFSDRIPRIIKENNEVKQVINYRLFHNEINH